MRALPRRLTVVRHAMPVVDTALAPSRWGLSAEGAAAAASLALPTHAHAVSSPERKARQTLAVGCGVASEAVGTDPRFREVDRLEEVHDGFRDARRAWVAGDLDARHERWEGPDAAARRFHAGLIAHAAEHLVVGTHGMVLTAWMASQGRIDPGTDAVRFWETLRFPHVLELELPLLRVRAVLEDADGRSVLIKRTRPGEPSYWTAPGGGVQNDDASPEEALRRELREELGAEVAIGKMLLERRLDGIRSERFYGARIVRIDSARRGGPELQDPARGRYDVEFVALDGIRDLDLRPTELKDLLLRRHAASGAPPNGIRPREP